MEALISIVIPSYNRRDTIIPCIESVLSQTYGNIEVIVVDDASSDKTYELFEHFPDKRVHFYRYEKNQGACYARNLGASYAKGQYIAFQDSDDVWHPEKLEKQINYLVSNDSDFVFCGMNRLEPEAMLYYPTTRFEPTGDVVEQLLANNMISTQTMLMKRDVLDCVKFDISFKRFQDWDFALQVALEKFKIGYLEEALVNSAVQANSISVSAKTGMAYEHLFNKYKAYYEQYQHALATIYMYQARGYRGVNYKKVRHYLRLSLKAELNIKTLAKLALSIFRLWK